MPYQPMLSTVIESQTEEVLVHRQSALAAHARETRTVLQALPPDVTHALLADYQLPPRETVADIEAAVASRELALDNAAQGVGLDLAWLAADGGARRPDERAIGADDAWNLP